MDGYDEDWRALWWVRASGTGRVVDDGTPEHAAALSARVQVPAVRERTPPGPVVAIDIERISGWRAGPEPGLGKRS